MKIVYALLIVLAFALPASAQTASWAAPDNLASAAQAPTLEYRLYVNNGAAVLLSGVTCSGALPTVTCTAPLPAGTPQTIGTKYELTAKETNSTESPRSVPFIQPAHAPINLRTS